MRRTGCRLSTPLTEFVAFDLESTGLSAKTDSIIEIGAVRFTLEDGIKDEFQTFVDPGRPVPLAIQRLTGIRDDDLAGQPAPSEAVMQLLEFCRGAFPVAHGAEFDTAYVNAVTPDSFRRDSVMDTLELARILLPQHPGHGLENLSQNLALPHDRPHRALSDATATAKLLSHLVDTFTGLPGTVREEMLRVARQQDNALCNFLSLAHEFRETAPDRFAAHTPDLELMLPVEYIAPEISLEQSVNELLGTEGPLATETRYELRDAQLQMATAVAQKLERGGRLLVEAGTGVGKSLAYLAPTALWLLSGKRRAVVATHTITLQEQLIAHDLAALQSVLPRPLRVALLKGSHHYLSWPRWQRFLHGADTGDAAAIRESIIFKLKILCWLEQTTTGDRAELRLTARERELWRHIQSEGSDCIGPGCGNCRLYRCYVKQARDLARAAELVITNQALLMTRSTTGTAILGDFDALIVDEAHNLEDVASRSLGHSIRGENIDLAVGTIPDIGNHDIAVQASVTVDCSRRVFGEVKGLMADLLGGQSGNGITGLTDELRGDAKLASLTRAGWQLEQALNETADLLVAAEVHDAQTAHEVQVSAQSLRDLALGVRHILLEPRRGYVSYMEMRAERAELHDVPIYPGDVLGPDVLDEARTTILTSATLAVNDNFDFIRHRLGLGGNAEELLLASPYDFLRQAICITVSDIPPYDDSRYDEVLADIVAKVALQLQGRTLALFTSYGALRRTQDLIGRTLSNAGIAVLAQGLDGTRHQLLKSFQESDRTVLLGTGSFWEGIDIPGDALQCVVLAKIPFAVPTDPVVQARTAECHDAFHEYVLPLAALKMRQGFGRLIRSRTDHGAVVLCDSRIGSRNYANQLLESLPQASRAAVSSGHVAARIAEFMTEATTPSGV